jgi:hypothetical protein
VNLNDIDYYPPQCQTIDKGSYVDWTISTRRDINCYTETEYRTDGSFGGGTSCGKEHVHEFPQPCPPDCT